MYTSQRGRRGGNQQSCGYSLIHRVPKPYARQCVGGVTKKAGMRPGKNNEVQIGALQIEADDLRD